MKRSFCIILIILFIFLLCGCENKKCIKSHVEEKNCYGVRSVRFGNNIRQIPYQYNCNKKICDEYEEVQK